MSIIICARCDKEVGELGAFLPGYDSELVCTTCFHSQIGRAALPEDTDDNDQVARAGVYHSPKWPKKRRRNEDITYTQIEVKRTHTGNTIRKIIKRNILTLKNLPPGSYTVSVRRPQVKKIIRRP